MSGLKVLEIENNATCPLSPLCPQKTVCPPPDGRLNRPPFLQHNIVDTDYANKHRLQRHKIQSHPHDSVPAPCCRIVRTTCYRS